jgi:hypothetical protein
MDILHCYFLQVKYTRYEFKGEDPRGPRSFSIEIQVASPREKVLVSADEED